MASRMIYANAGEYQADEDLLGSSSGSDDNTSPDQQSRLARRGVAIVATILGVAACVYAVSGHSDSTSLRARAAPHDRVGLQAVAAQPPAAMWNPNAQAAVPPELQNALQQLPKLSPQLDDYFNQGMGDFRKGDEYNVCGKGEELFSGLCYKSCSSFTNGTLTHRQSAFECCDYDRSNDQKAGTCRTGEELYAGMCYKTCADLTKGKAPLRTSAWTCCAAAKVEDCSITDVKHDVGACSGFSVEADGQSCPKPPGICKIKKGTSLCGGYGVSTDGKCPHTPGMCLDDEEMHLNSCYKKCALLTNGTMPHRMSAWTCCKLNSFSCISPSNSDTSSGFAVSGGKGDNDPSTPSSAHGPITTAAPR